MAIDTDAIVSGDRRSLAKGITLIESTREADRVLAQDLLNGLLPRTGKSIRIGITGVPGVGKSTFIEAFGLYLIGLGHRVAVLAVDPSSPVAGGSILGDKTRMELLSRSDAAFIRPSPAGAALGGVAQKTRESMLLCEAAGYDVILVETVGVGQSEHQVAQMVDFFLVLMLPGGGDELQGIKKGIIELADAIVINKADGDSEAIARLTRQHYSSALSLLSHDAHWSPEVVTCSALHKRDVDSVWTMVEAFKEASVEAGALEARRAKQNLAWMYQLIDEMLRVNVKTNQSVQSMLPEIENEVSSATITPLAGAHRIIALSQQ
ncbi:MAG: methylmalonyl Co-A mutase-associated GTPase MeaB [Halieaceae bacterium]